MKAALLLFLSVVGLIFTSAKVAAEANFCLLTSRAALHSCRMKARSDWWLAIGKCDNVAGPMQRKNCKEKASAPLKDALSECEDQHSVRDAACKRLGPETYDPVIDPANFVDRIDNPYFPLTPGTVFIYEGQTEHGREPDEFFVTHKTVKILGVTTVEVHDTVTVDGKLTEDTLDWFAQDKEGNVWYFGENTMELENGRPSTLAGSFKAGVNRAKPGIV